MSLVGSPVVELVALVIAAGLVAAALAALYRARLGSAIQPSLAVLAGLGVLAIYLNTTAALGQVMGGDAIAIEVVLSNAVAVIAGVAVGAAGQRVGDSVGLAVRDQSGVADDLGRVVASVGRTTTVTLPDAIDDAVGYDPIDDPTRAALAGRTMSFPRGLTASALESRLEDRLRRDHGVAYADCSIDQTGSVTACTLGARPAGLGPTLPAETVAMAIRADPPLAAGPGDLVRVVRSGETVTTAEIRGVVGDVVTIACPAADASAIDPAASHRLVTLAAEASASRAFAAVLRRADETVVVIEVGEASPLVGLPVGAVRSAVLAVVDGETVALPPADHQIAAGNALYVVDTPDRLGALQALA